MRSESVTARGESGAAFKLDAESRWVAILPAFNEEGSVGLLLRELKELTNSPDLVVIDDGSADRTAEVARSLGATVIRMPFNSGIGATVQAGLRYAVQKRYDLVVRLDADGQHDPADLSRLKKPLTEARADLVLGSRYLERRGFQSTWLRRVGSSWFGILLRPLLGQKITDPTSGFWMANTRAAEVLAREYSYDYPEVDALVRLRLSGCRIVELPVNMRQRQKGRSSISGLKVPYYMLKVTLALLIAWLRPHDAVAARSPARARVLENPRGEPFR
jgi:glycosyltransferase involved in cell wall biosynthesis